MSNHERISFVLMFILAVFLIIIGFQGSLGKVVGCIVTPSIMVVDS